MRRNWPTFYFPFHRTKTFRHSVFTPENQNMGKLLLDDSDESLKICNMH